MKDKRPSSTSGDARAQRLERALRDNLRRRKAQAKARDTNQTGSDTAGEKEAGKDG